MKPLVFALLLVVASGLKTPSHPVIAQVQSPDQESWSVTDHTIRVGGQTIPYKASAGTTLLTTDAGELGLRTGLMWTREAANIAYCRRVLIRQTSGVVCGLCQVACPPGDGPRDRIKDRVPLG